MAEAERRTAVSLRQQRGQVWRMEDERGHRGQTGLNLDYINLSPIFQKTKINQEVSNFFG